MSRFFIPPEQIHGTNFILSGSEARHAVLVMRRKPGDTIELFDGKDRSYHGRIDSASPEAVTGVLLDEIHGPQTWRPEITLYPALLKGPKWDWLIEKACEIGVHRVVPIRAARCVVKPSQTQIHERWSRIALAAAKQCGRADVMAISEPETFARAVSQPSPDFLTLIPWEKETESSIRAACQNRWRTPIRVFVGPEGGWETVEVETARAAGAIPVQLGPNLLRSETAALVAVTLVMAAYE